MTTRVWLVVAAFGLALNVVPARACTIPVFRYALERWDADRFQVVVFHQGALSAEDAEALDRLHQRSVVQGGPLNIEVVRYDLSASEPPKMLEIARPPAGQALPWVEVRTRKLERGEGQPQWTRRWQGALAAALSEPGVFDSPARQEVVRRILQGHSAVWLVVAPDRAAGKQAGEVLQKYLDEASEEIPLPQGIGLPGSELFAPVPLEIRFSVVTIDHRDQAEGRFLELLAAHAPDWKPDQTYVIPIFGRARALEVIPHGELDAPLTEEIAAFLCGACSCQVKQANPGFDLLVSAPWEEHLFGRATGPSADLEKAEPVTENPSEPSKEPLYVEIPAGQITAAPVDSDRTVATAVTAGDLTESPANRAENAGRTSRASPSARLRTVLLSGFGTVLIAILMGALLTVWRARGTA